MTSTMVCHPAYRTLESTLPSLLFDVESGIQTRRRAVPHVNFFKSTLVDGDVW